MVADYPANRAPCLGPGRAGRCNKMRKPAVFKGNRNAPGGSAELISGALRGIFFIFGA